MLHLGFGDLLHQRFAVRLRLVVQQGHAQLAAQAMWASGQATNMVEVCTSTGMVRVAIDAADDLDDAGSSAFAQSCPFCLLHDGQAMPPPSATAFPLTESYAGMPPAFYQATHTSAVWLAALSRGPPLLLS